MKKDLISYMMSNSGTLTVQNILMNFLAAFVL